MLRISILLALLCFAAPGRAEQQRADGPVDAGVATSHADAAKAGAPRPPIAASTRESICLLIEAAARANGLPVEFFARLIWQESRFDAEAVGPRTRSGARALGIAQFMPATAAERRLLDPFDPIQALPKSAAFLRELRAEFGNLGLAAAGYNGGPQRLRDYLAGSGYMPAETRNYVAAITGSTIDEWIGDGSDSKRFPVREGAPDCDAMVAMLKRAPTPFVTELEERVAKVETQPWGVQLAAGFSRPKALAAYARLARRYANVLAQHDPSILAGRLRHRGTRTFYQVRIGAGTRDEAERLCTGIRRSGGPCMVLRNARGR